MILLRTTTLALLAGLATAFLATAPAALADDEDDAREACRQIASNRNWEDIDTDVDDEDDGKITVTISGKRNGEDRERECVYDTDSKQATFDDQ